MVKVGGGGSRNRIFHLIDQVFMEPRDAGDSVLGIQSPTKTTSLGPEGSV